MGGAVAVKGLYDCAEGRLRGVARDGSAKIHASMAAAPCGRDRGIDGARLLALRVRSQHSFARDVSSLSPRAGSLKTPVDAERALCSRVSGVVQDLGAAHDTC